MQKSYPRMGINSVAPKTPVEFSESFAPVVLRLPIKAVARAADVSTETVKAWRSEKTFASGASLINAAKTIPSIKTWLLSEIGHDETAEFGSEHFLTGIVSAIVRVSSEKSPEGNLARRLLQEMAKSNQQQEP